MRQEVIQVLFVVACGTAMYFLGVLLGAMYEACKALTATCHALQAWLHWTMAEGEGEACREGEE